MWNILQDDAHYFAAFKKSKMYIKLLAELDLLQDATAVSKPTDASGDADVYHNGTTVVLAMYNCSICYNYILQLFVLLVADVRLVMRKSYQAVLMLLLALSDH